VAPSPVKEPSPEFVTEICRTGGLALPATASNSTEFGDTPIEGGLVTKRLIDLVV
jgi:hypothetical protein